MCGIVSYFGRSHGVTKVLNALELLAYRAPDSSGLAIIDDSGKFTVRRSVGTAKQLREKVETLPLPSPRKNGVQIVSGHGRWAMVGAVTENNSHPISDRSQTRIVCENGSHNAYLMLNAMTEQERWWQERGAKHPIHRTQNSTEVLAYEWERIVCQLKEGGLSPRDQSFLQHMDEWQIEDDEEKALRLAVWRLKEGNAHACTFHSLHRPDTLYITSHNKPIAIIKRTLSDGQQELMVASDVNAALMLWPKDMVKTAVIQIQAAQSNNAPQSHIEAILDQFTVEVIFLDDTHYQGQELFTCIYNGGEHGQIHPKIEISRYDGTPLTISADTIKLNPAMVGKGEHPSYTESHIAEIPEVIDRIIAAYIQEGQPQMESIWHEGKLFRPGLNTGKLRHRFGPGLGNLRRLLLIGEGSSWRNALSAAPLFLQLLPDVQVNIYRPVEILNLGPSVDASSDLAIEISWSGTTDSLLKADKWLAKMDVMRLGITGRPQSDLGRRAVKSSGMIDVLSGVEISVATVKGFQAILMSLDLLAVQLAGMRSNRRQATQLMNELALLIPQHIRDILSNQSRRDHMRHIARRCRHFNKVMVVGSSPIDVEAELKIEELAQIVASTSDFHATSLQPLIERSAWVDDDRQRVLFIINATTSEAQKEAHFLINHLDQSGLFCLVHTTPNERSEAWQALPNVEVFLSPTVSKSLQPLIDAPFFFDLAVAMAYARGLTPNEIDRPRNLAKSVTTTGAEERTDVETRREFHNVDLKTFNDRRLAQQSRNLSELRTSRDAWQAMMTLEMVVAFSFEPFPEPFILSQHKRLSIITGSEAIENAVYMADAAWQELVGINLSVQRQFMTTFPQGNEDTRLLHLMQSGAVLSVRDENSVVFPAVLSFLQTELLGSIYLTGLAIQVARQRGIDTTLWETGVAQLPSLVAEMLSSQQLPQEISTILSPFVNTGYDKLQIIGGGQDYASARSIAYSLRMHGFLAEALYTDSAWHGPLATVGGPDADHDTLIIILATDPLFQAAALVDTQVYRARHAPVLLLVPAGNEELPVVHGVDATAVLVVPAVPYPFLPIVNATIGTTISQQMSLLWKTD